MVAGTIQQVILRAYRLVNATGVFATPWGTRLFEACYDLYKSGLEAGPVERLRRFVGPGDWIVDAGANIGFFALRFGRWVSAGGRVVAIECEPRNFARLSARLARAGLRDAVEAVEAAAVERGGTALLQVNPHHQGDHRLAATGLPVAAVAIDELVAAHGSPRVALIKVDVQGSEHRVIRGAEATIRRCRPVLFVEVDDALLRAAGSSACDLIAHIEGLGYRAHRFGADGISVPADAAAVVRTKGRFAYADIAFLPQGASG